MLPGNKTPTTRKFSKLPYSPDIRRNEYYDCWYVASSSRIYQYHRVRLDKVDDQLLCSCPWGRSKTNSKNKPCKHVMAVKAMLEEAIHEQK